MSSPTPPASDASEPEPSLFDRTAATRVEPDLEDARVHAAVKARLFGRPPAPLRIDRFTLIERLGEGGAGEVWSAYDPRLDRRVAIKVLHARRKDREAAGRLVREAQVAGRLSHPNIVSVFDVGVFEERVFLAMEFIDGQDLAHWRSKQRPETDRILDVFLQAGQGLAEAHRHGIVHRDFKPANVMLQRTRGGPRARVVDFGLARIDADADAWEHSDPAEAPPESPSASGLTRTGQRMGTPAYMAPEQYDGRPVDARSDQFSFCVALVESLAGQRPFAYPGLFDLVPDAMARVPRHLRPALRRGLSERPAERWPSMDELLTAIAPRPRWMRLRRMAPIVGVAVMALGAIAVTAGLREPPCESVASSGPDWSPARRAAIEEALAASSSPLAEGTWARLEPRLEDFVERWQDGDRRVCENARTGTLSPGLHDRALACLSRARHRFDTLVGQLERPTTQSLESLVPMALGLGSVDRCTDPATPELGVALPEDPALRAAVQRGRELLIDAQIATQLGETARSRDLLDQARSAVEPEHDPSFDVEVVLEEGRVLFEQGQASEATERLEDAYRGAETRDHDAVKLDAAIALAGAYWQTHPERARWWSSAAVAIAERIDPSGRGMFRALSERLATAEALEDDDTATRTLARMTTLAEASPGPSSWSAQLSFWQATRALHRGRLDDARLDAERAHLTYAELYGPAHPETLQAQMLLGTILRRDQALDEARLNFEAVTTERTALYGPEHPSVAEARVELALLADLRGDLEEAEALYLQALPILEASEGAASLRVSTVLENLGIVRAQQGRFGEAAAAFERALTIVQALLGPEHSTVAFSHHNLANVYLDAGRLADAREHARQAVALRRRTLGSTHPKLAKSLGLLAGIERRLGQPEAARAAVDEALTVVEAGLGPDSPQLPWFLQSRALIELDAGRTHAAVADLRRAIAIERRDPERSDPADAAAIRFSLAQALAATGEPEAASAMAREALTRWQALGEGRADERHEVERWLAAHGDAEVPAVDVPTE